MTSVSIGSDSTGAKKSSPYSLTPHPSIKEKVSIPLSKIVKYDTKVPKIGSTKQGRVVK